MSLRKPPPPQKKTTLSTRASSKMIEGCSVRTCHGLGRTITHGRMQSRISRDSIILLSDTVFKIIKIAIFLFFLRSLECARVTHLRDRDTLISVGWVALHGHGGARCVCVWCVRVCAWCVVRARVCVCVLAGFISRLAQHAPLPPTSSSGYITSS